MITYIKGDLFTHEIQGGGITVFVHACNCRGSWGAGVATQFRKRFPSGYREYVEFCEKQSDQPSRLLGKTLLIPNNQLKPGTSVYVACLFTSDFAGRKKLLPPEILTHTRAAMQDLTRQLVQLSSKVNFEKSGAKIVLNMPKINAGLFDVPWGQTEKVLQEFKDLQINVYVID